jgi:hypothetical protein
LMEPKTCGCGKVWTIEAERTHEEQAAHEVRCDDCGVQIVGAEKRGFIKFTATREDWPETGPNPFFPGRR